MTFAGTVIRNYFAKNNTNNVKTEFVKKKINNLYLVEVPNYLNETNQLNEVASYQGYNKNKHAFLIVIDDLKTGRYTLEEYNKMVEEKFKAGFTNSKILNKKNVKVGNCNAIQYKIEASSNNETIYALFTVIEGTTNFFQILAWTSIKNYDQFFNDVQKTVNSFKELKK